MGDGEDDAVAETVEVAVASLAVEIVAAAMDVDKKITTAVSHL